MKSSFNKKYYQNSGAYIFRPCDKHKTAAIPYTIAEKFYVYQGNLSTWILIKYRNSEIESIVRFYNY